MKNIFSIRSSETLSKKEQLAELLQYNKQIKNCPQGIDSVYTFLLLTIGVVYYKLADYSNAIRFTSEALSLIHSHADKPSVNKKYLPAYYYYLSIYYDSLKLVAQKNEAIDSCISNEIRLNTNYHYASLVLLDNVKYLYNKGDYNLCADRAAIGESLIHQFYKYNDSTEIVVYFIYYKASALRSLKKFDEEEQFLQNKKNEFSKQKNKDYNGIIYSLLGYLNKDMGLFSSSIQNFEKALFYDKASRFKQLSADVLSQVGLINYENLHQPKIALNYYFKALAQARFNTAPGGAAADSLNILGNIANLYTGMRSFDLAYRYFQEAFDKIKPGLNENDLLRDIENYVNANTAENVLKLVLDKAGAYSKQYHAEKNTQALGRALAVYKTADKLLDKIRNGQNETQSRLFWQRDAHGFYEHAIEVCFLQNNVEDAFYFFEKSHAVLLNQQLNQQSKIAESDIMKLAQLKNEILLLERERDAAVISSVEYIDIQKKIIVLKQTMERFSLTMKQSNPLYYATFVDTSRIALNAVKKKLLINQQAFLELFEGDSVVFSLLITKQQTYLNKISKREFDSTTGVYNRYISNQSLLNGHFSEFVKASRYLYRLIFGVNKCWEQRIIISPDGNYFPFESLVTSASQAPVYFLTDHAVSYTYSARYIMNDFNPGLRDQSGNFMGVAPINFSTTAELSALAGSDNSLNAIKKYFPVSKVFLLNNATKANFINQFVSYKIVQLYTHASENSDRKEPVIYFADSALYLSELIPEKKPLTKLIVLSACGTGKGTLYSGEGVFSFNRGFAALGIPSSVTNLWSIDNVSTYKLTELFYKYLSQNLPLDIALQKAKLEFINSAEGENQLPYYWAASVLVGKTDPITIVKPFAWKYLFAGIGLASIVFFTWKKLIKRKSPTPTPGTTQTAP